MEAASLAAGFGSRDQRKVARQRTIRYRAACLLVGGLVAAQVACAPSTSSPRSPVSVAQEHPGRAADRKSAGDREDEELDRVAAIHGAPGPWAVAGYRMGRYALTKLGLSPGSFDLEVTHHTPQEVMYSCIADGAAAATGASAGKLNLKLVESRAEDVETTYLRKSTRQAITLRPTAKFRARFADAARERARELGREVLRSSDADIFEEVAASPSPKPSWVREKD
jgi:formylmethanofuran dehydrogenase subunit E